MSYAGLPPAPYTCAEERVAVLMTCSDLYCVGPADGGTEAGGPRDPHRPRGLRLDVRDAGLARERAQPGVIVILAPRCRVLSSCGSACRGRAPR